MAEVEIKVDNIAKTMQGLVANDKWYNFPKGSSSKFEGVNKGDTVMLALDEDGKVAEFKVTGKAEPKKAFVPGKGGGGRAPKTPEENAMIARHKAVESVMLSPWMLNTKDNIEDNIASAKEMMLMLEKFIVTGKF